MNLEKSSNAFIEANKYIPGGVNSPVRAFKAVTIDPLFISRGKGSKIYDIDGNEYVDYVGSWGPLILGHCHPEVVKALKDMAERGTSFGAPTEIETEMAKLICDAVPSVEMVRMVNSGTEATMSALRLARAYTGREIIVKFIGNYHGHSDSLLVKAGSGALTHGIPDSPGVPVDIVKNTITARYNDIADLKNIFDTHGDNIAAVIIEPVAGNMGVVPSSEEFMEALRNITKEYGSLLIMDEVMTGFRLSYHGAQSLYKVDPDITCFAKIIGGGLPVGAYGGKRKIMENVSPMGAVYQAGTLSGNPLAMAAGVTTLRILKEHPEIYQSIEDKSRRLEEGFRDNASKLGIDIQINRVGSMLCLYFTKDKVSDFDSAVTSDTVKFAKYFEAMLKEGIYLSPSQFESIFISNAHTDEDIEKTITANYNAMKTLL
ncbi:glutamate-1-semialdehyde 2,1-aminomutase [Geosporobacter subterraneus DSM 17957]|uniref:Glutamate-1-semialdehyde 2,1-aminomutase n=1 Tax=Geosporobacter subterraneus DSM 17957 TaxID=1121919 RepID=A0A1M6MWH1_9FIRM|nr:glutamate-1-semialdehyde 2,1-aminomutase [Geosporobacter subterraneus]SHJ87811.1 glutamate-1-semialdehyde 2,1-aminomutase [Geosporobacter subterraneus DSM 17957]